MQLYQFIGYFIGITVVTYGVMYLIEWLIRKKGVFVRSVISTGSIFIGLSVIGWMTHFHVFLLYSYCACIVILWNRYWYYYNGEHVREGEVYVSK